jgi:hypothetical protein
MGEGWAMRAYRVGASGIHGRGVFAARALRAGETIGFFRGRAARRPLRGADGHIYAIGREEGGFLVPHRPVGLWFLNHSCDANAEIWLTPRGGRLVALRRIRRGEELACDYRPSLHNGRLACRCGARGCSGRI